MKGKFELEAKIASEWWSSNIGANAKQNNGDEVQSFMLSMLSRMTRLSNDQKTVFRDSLTQKLSEALAKRGGYLQVSVDTSGPDLILLESAREAGISSNVFPCSTTMWIEPEKVSVSCGYKAKMTNVFEEQEELQPGANR